VCNASWGLVCIALDKSLLLFSENCCTLKLQLTFDHEIDTVSMYIIQVKFVFFLVSKNYLDIGLLLYIAIYSIFVRILASY